MAVIDKPLSKEDQKKIDKVIPDLEAAIDKIDDLQKCYEDAAATADSFSTNRSLGNTNVPWNTSSNVFEQRNAFEYIYSEPLQAIMGGGRADTTTIGITGATEAISGVGISNTENIIEGFAKGVRYDQIFNDHQHFIKGPGNSLSNLLTEARTNLDTFNVVNYQSNLTNAKKLLVLQMIEPVRIFIQSLEVTDDVITDPQSLFYKSGFAYGTTATYNSETIADFDMGSEMDSLREQAAEIFTKLRNLFNAIDALSKIKEDILKRVVLSNQGFKEDPKQPGSFIKGTNSKDGWGIKFSYKKNLNSREFIDRTGQNNALNNSLTQTRSRDSNRQQQLNDAIIQQNADFINDTELSVDKEFYMILLPAIKSNLPVQGGVDVPGTMPGLQFRIMNNIVKHKIPGFSPIYQPLGIDSIKCTMVGLFTGHDGVSIDSTLREDLIVSTRSQSLFNKTEGEVPKVIPFDIVGQAKEGYSDSTFSAPGRVENNEAANLWNHVPNSKNTTGGVSMTYDAFMNAQEFYNEIVVSGVEVEIEINTRARSGGQPGGVKGPFRDSETGNAKFKALIKQMDMYYVRQDRVYYILDLLITNSGLIGNECINLTNVIEEATELFETVEVERNIELEELLKCFNERSVRRFKFKGDRRDTSLVVDTSTGLSYELQGADRLVPGSFKSTSETILSLINFSRQKATTGGGGFLVPSQNQLIVVIRDILLSSNTGPKPTNAAIEDSISGITIPIIRSISLQDNNTGYTIYANDLVRPGVRYRRGDNRFVLYDYKSLLSGNERLITRNGEAFTLEFNTGVKSISAGGSGTRRSQLFAGLAELTQILTFNKPNKCDSLFENESQLEDTQTPINSNLIESQKSFVISSVDDIINSTNTSIQLNERVTTAPGQFDTPELRDRLDSLSNRNVISILNGHLDSSLISGLNDYLSLISTNENAPPISNNTLVTTDLINITKRNKANFFSETTGKVRDVEVLTANGKSNGVNGISNSEFINVILRTRINGSEDFIVKSGSNTQVFPGTTFAVFNIQLGLYTKTSTGFVEGSAEGLQSYRMKSIKLNNPYTTVNIPRRRPVPNAPETITPGDNNTPSKPSFTSQAIDAFRAQSQLEGTTVEVSADELQSGIEEVLDNIGL